LDLAREMGYHRDETEAIGNLGNIAYERSDLAAALQLHRLAFDRYSQNGDIRGQAVELVNLANVALASSDDQTTFRLFGQALTLFRQIGYKLGQAVAVLGQGHIRYRAKEWEVAVRCYRETSSLAEELQQPELQRVALTNLGFVHERQGQFVMAEECYRQAIELTESGRRSISQEVSRIAYFAGRINPYERLILLRFVDGYAGEVFSIVEQARARAFLDLLAGAWIESSEPPLIWTEVRDLLAV
jgi:tetratricopeptide (TPR) repeat protein